MYDVAIVGGGTAGASAAVFIARAGLKAVVIDADKGMTKRALANNHLGFPGGVEGPELVESGRAHATKYGAEWVTGTVSSIESSDQGFVVTADDQQYPATEVIMATGAQTLLAEAAGLNVVAGTEPHIRKVFDVDTQGRTNVEGIWAAGTAAGVSVHTIITAGDGAKVAVNLISARKGERYADHDVMPSE